MDRAIILGASRGLGAELVKFSCAQGYPVVGYGRKEPALRGLREAFPLFEYQIADFSKAQDELISTLQTANFNKLFYVAGGGPYGPYAQADWKDHQWALQVSFLFPARLLHALAKAHRFEQVIVVGSSVAEREPDPNAASYCAAKHALRGLVETLRLEYPSWDLRLFSPGYMDTALLPANAAVRQHGVWSARQLAQELWTWSLSADDIGHRVYPRHPS